MLRVMSLGSGPMSCMSRYRVLSRSLLACLTSLLPSPATNSLRLLQWKKNNGFVILSHEYSRSNYTHRAPTDLCETTSDKATMSLCNFQINREVKQAPGMGWHPTELPSKLRGLAFTFEQTSELGQPLYKCHDSLV